MSEKTAKKVIAIENLSKSFGDHQVLRKIDFAVEKGEVICIVGSSGSGKSTLLRCINKLEQQTDGKIYFNGKEVADKQKEINEYRSKVGMVFQSFNLFENMTVLKNCMIAVTSVLHESKQEAFERAIKHLKAVGMAPYINAYPSQLSGGQKQRVAIARVLASDPKILLCDEATSALDPQTTKAILELIKEINRDYGITVVVITHEMSVVQEICNRVAVLESGTLVESGTVEELFRSPKTEAARRLVFSGRTQIQKMEGKRLVRVTFRDKSSFEPVIANLVLTYRTPVNILYADTKNIGGAAEGEMILQLPEIEEVADKMIQYLKDTNMGVEELKSDVG